MSHSLWKLTYPGTSATPVAEIIDTKDLSRCFVGKGTPDAISTTLRIAAGLGLADSTSAALNDFCSDTIGLDCSGFVGNYLTQEGLDPNGYKKGSREFAPHHRRISKLDDIRAQSVIVWKDTNHVALVDKVEPVCRMDGSVHAWVAESCGSQLVPGDIHTDGLNYTEYVFEKVDKHQVFTVFRGIGKHKSNHLWIANY